MALPPGSILLSSGDNQSAVINTQFASPITVQLFDSGGQPMDRQTIIFTLPSSGASGTFATGNLYYQQVLTDASGHATTSAIVANGAVGGWRGTAQSSTSPNIQITWGATNRSNTVSYSITSGGSQSVKAGANYAAIVVNVKDVYGNNAYNARVEFIIPATYATFGGATDVNVYTDGAGNASSPIATATANPGPFDVNIYLPDYLGSTIALTAKFTNIGAGNIWMIYPAAGTPQTTPVNAAFATAPVVLAVDVDGNPPPPRTNVRFQAPVSGPSCSWGGANYYDAVVGPSGYAGTTIPVANGAAGDYIVVCTPWSPAANQNGKFFFTNSYPSQKPLLFCEV